MNAKPKSARALAIAALGLITCGELGARIAGAAETDRTPAGASSEGKVKSTADDAEIFGVLENANSGEVDQGKLAMTKAHAPAVKSFAKMMVVEHGAALQKSKELARRLGISPSPSDRATKLKARSDKLVSELAETAAAAFDRKYMQSQVSLHQDVLKLIDRELAPRARAQDLKSLLGDMRTHVEHHLDVAQKTLSDLTTSGAS